MAQGRQRTMPTSDELRVWRAYIETSDALRALMASRLQAESGISMGDYAVLLALSEAGEHRFRSSELADKIGWERSRLSHHLGRMEKRGLIQRVACADDSRGAEVVMTDAGAGVFRSSSVRHLRAIRETFVDAFDAEQLAQLQQLTVTLRAHLGLDARE